MPTQTIDPPLQQMPQRGRSAATTAHPEAARTPSRLVTEIYQPWDSRMWPCSAAEEATFVIDLRELSATSSSEFDRRDVTALVTALRGGLSAEALLDSARGLKPTRLVAAYVELDRRRSATALAWCTLTKESTAEALRQHAPAASLLLFGVVGQVVRDVQRTGDVHRVISDAAARVSRATGDVIALEQRLADSTTPAGAREIGARLNNGRETGAWNLDAFLPTRVGSLMPLRVAALLGEQQPNGTTARW